MDWLKILIEDILRLLKEKDKPLSIREIELDTKSEISDIREAIEKLKEKNLVKEEKGCLSLTKEGEETAKRIYDYHKAIESLFSHEVAHSIEHLEEDVRERVKIIKGEAKPIEEMEEGIISAIKVENPKTLSRIIGIGLIPGASFKVLKLRDDVIILESKGRLIALDRALSKSLLGVERNEGLTSRTT
ncbi:MAG: FeoA domain-containing protein [Synergistetes bacterium]|nr:FeoA domain-containing protein [Synergistota bacterium]MDW8191720.1 FeoA domain-containing protein [Synergistota bacterium]